ncbi:MAG: hypothetical protein WCW30_00095 [Candidatus Gracilibacteria bacterium]
MKNFKNPSGLSLIFAIITMTIIMVVAGTMSASFLRANTRNMDLFRSIQAYYASRASMEKAIADVADPTHGIGYESSSAAAISWDTNRDGTEDVTGTYEIFSQAKPLDWQSAGSTCDGTQDCYIPIPGTGDVGTSCDFEDTSASWATGTDAADDDCNWNRIGYGETVTIPLFYTDPDSPDGELVNSYITGSETFKLRVRTPMDPDTGIRYQLDEGEDKVIMSWEFNGTCNDGGSDYTCYLTPITIKGEETFIYDYSINEGINSKDFIVINIQDYSNPTIVKSGTDDQNYIFVHIYEFLTATYLDYTHTINQPYFKITLPQSLIAEDGITSIPYLEYQLITNTPIADNKIVYISDGKANGKLETYVRHMQATQSIENDSIINFVIQN